MKTERPISEDDLQAFIDGALDEARRAEVQTYLDAHPETAARIAGYRAQAEALRTALRPFADQPLPPGLGVRTLVARRRA
ncbi:MAG: anti-sigma factor, partial [Alphaproteobacteria bacterium]|nr:anti-sigma factor [Alphaproteobacteria bacterium]